MGDNITPPQQAFNWVADVYGSTEEIKARGQVIVGLMHEDIGHLGIFVSGKVAKGGQYETLTSATSGKHPHLADVRDAAPSTTGSVPCSTISRATAGAREDAASSDSEAPTTIRPAHRARR